MVITMSALEQELRAVLEGEQLMMFDALIKRETRDGVILEDALDVSDECSRYDYVDNAKFETSVKDAIHYHALSARLLNHDWCISMIDDEGEQECYYFEALNKAILGQSAINLVKQAIKDIARMAPLDHPGRHFTGIELSFYKVQDPNHYFEQSGVLSLENMKAYIEQELPDEETV